MLNIRCTYAFFFRKSWHKRVTKQKCEAEPNNGKTLVQQKPSARTHQVSIILVVIDKEFSAGAPAIMGENNL